jgi:hypothetical protein
MKGIIFAEYLEMVADVFSPAMVEQIIDASNLPSEGAYTEVGTYDHQELIRLVANLSKATKISISELEITYGKYLFKKLLTRYSDLVSRTQTTFDFLQQVDQHIHVEVLKLYPEAELPRFECKMINSNLMTMEYRSNHPFADLAEGLILGCAEHFNEKFSIKKEKLSPKEGKIHVVLFTLTKEE